MIIRALALAASCALVSTASLAQAQAPAQPAKPAAQNAAPKPAPKPATRPAQPAQPTVRALPVATAEQLEASRLAHYGDYACEFDQTVKVANHSTEGYVNVSFKGRTWVMKPVLSSTGALRLEDVGGRTLMIQIASKSMLMDSKIGQRLVDECVHAEQAKSRQPT
jgi:hypothetical protein